MVCPSDDRLNDPCGRECLGTQQRFSPRDFIFEIYVIVNLVALCQFYGMVKTIISRVGYLIISYILMGSYQQKLNHPTY